MALLRRRVPASVTPVPASRPAVVNRPVRRIRVVQNNAATRAQLAQETRGKINEHLKLIANLDSQLDELMVRLNAEHAEVEALLRKAKIDKHSDGAYIASIEEVVSRQSRTVDPKRFKAAVADSDFWGCVSVSVTKAEKVLSERELNEISRIVPGQVTGYAFKLKRLESK